MSDILTDEQIGNMDTNSMLVSANILAGQRQTDLNPTWTEDGIIQTVDIVDTDIGNMGNCKLILKGSRVENKVFEVVEGEVSSTHGTGNMEITEMSYSTDTISAQDVHRDTQLPFIVSETSGTNIENVGNKSTVSTDGDDETRPNDISEDISSAIDLRTELMNDSCGRRIIDDRNDEEELCAPRTNNVLNQFIDDCEVNEFVHDHDDVCSEVDDDHHASYTENSTPPNFSEAGVDCAEKQACSSPIGESATPVCGCWEQHNVKDSPTDLCEEETEVMNATKDEYSVRVSDETSDVTEDSGILTDPVCFELSLMSEPGPDDSDSPHHVDDRLTENRDVSKAIASVPSLRARKRKKQKAKLDKYLSRHVAPQNSRRKYASSFKELLPGPEDEFHPDFTCPVCLDLYHKPHLVSPCQHMFCEPCLRKLPSSAMADNAVCPLCRCDIRACTLDVDLHLQLSTYYSYLYNKRARQEKKLKTNQNPLPRLYTTPLSQQIIRQIFRNSQTQRRNQSGMWLIFLGVCMSGVMSVLYVWMNIPLQITTGPLRNAAVSNIWIQALCLFAVLSWLFVRLLQSFAEGVQR